MRGRSRCLTASGFRFRLAVDCGGSGKRSQRPPNHRRQDAGLVEATNFLTTMRRALSWAVAKDLVAADPTLGALKPLARPHTRDRVLSDDEIVAFWNGCEQIGWPFGPLFRLLLLTG